MEARKIKRKQSCRYSRDVHDINFIYIDGFRTYWKKVQVCDNFRFHPKLIQVNIVPYPSLIPIISVAGEKYVCLEVDNTTADNLLKLSEE